jgi:hypothetical protein
MSVLDNARAGQNALEQLVNQIPGFQGYRDKELRRDADRIQRELLSTRLEECKRSLDEAAVAATRSGSLDGINDLESARKRLDKVINRIRYADRGYAGFFATIKIDEAALARVYEFDLALVRDVDTVRAAAGLAGGKADIAALLTALGALDTRLGDRESALSGIA